MILWALAILAALIGPMTSIGGGGTGGGGSGGGHHFP